MTFRQKLRDVLDMMFATAANSSVSLVAKEAALAALREDIENQKVLHLPTPPREVPNPFSLLPGADFCPPSGPVDAWGYATIYPEAPVRTLEENVAYWEVRKHVYRDTPILQHTSASMYDMYCRMLEAERAGQPNPYEIPSGEGFTIHITRSEE